MRSNAPVVALEKPLDRFSKKFVLISEILDYDCREEAWDYHQQWIRRSNLDPRAKAVVTSEFTVLDVSCIHPTHQILIIEANTTDALQSFLKMEPLEKNGAVKSWITYEADLKSQENISMPIRQPHIFLGIYNESNDLFQKKEFPYSENNVSKDGYISGMSPRAFLAAKAKYNNETEMDRIERSQLDYHLQNSPNVMPPEALDPQRYMLESRVAREGGGYYEQKAQAAAAEDTVGGKVSLYMTLKGVTENSYSNGRSIGTLLLLNFGSVVEARKYMSFDPINSYPNAFDKQHVRLIHRYLS